MHGKAVLKCVFDDYVIFFSETQQQTTDLTVSRQSSEESSDSGNSTIDVSASSIKGRWVLLVIALASILDQYEKALQKMKSAGQQLVRHKPVKKQHRPCKKLRSIVHSPSYQKAANVGDFFDLLAPCWNWQDYGVLEILVYASQCPAAIKELQVFLEYRSVEAPDVVMHPTQMAKPESEQHEECAASTKLEEQVAQPESESPQEAVTRTPFAEPADKTEQHEECTALSKLEEQVAQPESESTQEAITSQPRAMPVDTGAVELDEQDNDCVATAKLGVDTLTLAQYDRTKMSVCDAFGIAGRYLLRLTGISKGSITIHWQVSSDLAAHLQHTTITAEALQALARVKVIEIRVGEKFRLHVPPLEYWEMRQPVEVIV